MKNIDGVIYYTLRETGFFINKSTETLRNWLKINEELLNKGKPAILPKPTMIKNIMHFSQSDLRYLREKMRHFHRGDFKQMLEKPITCDTENN